MGEYDDFMREWSGASDYIVAHTSGSTGAPKEIRLAKADMVVSARATCRRFGISSTSHLVIPLSVSYIAGKMMVVRSIVSGAKLTVLPPSRTLRGVAEIEGDIDLLAIVPAQLDALLTLANRGRIRNVIIGGAPLTASQEDAIRRSGLNVYATYGMTETCSHVALRKVGAGDVYEAMPGISFGLDDGSCLVIDAPEYTARCFVTNDVVELIDARHFRWLGRRDNVINSGGIKIIPEEVEAKLRPYMGAIDYYLTGRKSEVWGEELVMVVATGGMKVDVGPNLENAKAVLPHHMMPKAIIYVDTHRYTTTGKLIRCLDP